MNDKTLITNENYAVCRICLQHSVQHVSVKELQLLNVAHRKSILTNLFNAVSIQLLEDSKETKNICYNCELQLEQFLAFAEKCLQSEQILKTQSLKEETEKEEENWIHNDVSSGNESDEKPLIHFKNTKTFLCTNCPKKYKTEKRLLRHSYIHENSQLHQCESCVKKFPTIEALSNHVNETHLKQKNSRLVDESNGKSRCHICYVCDSKFNSKSLLSKHNAELHESRNVCFCGKQFNRNAKVVEHIAVFHQKNDLKRIQCDLCEMKFRYQSHLRHHKNKHLGIKPFLCSMCPASFSSPTNLSIHRKVHKTRSDESARYLCDNCGHDFSRKGHLYRHMIRRHTPDAPKNFACHLCGRAFLERPSLTAHIRTHSDEKPFQCQECERAFLTKQLRDMHIRRVHRGERPFPCATCGFAFKLKSHLVKHQLTHTGEKPFSCPQCPYSCAEKSNLVKHIKTHNRNR